MPFPPTVRNYTKEQLRVIIANPDIDTTDPDKLKASKYRLTRKKFCEVVNPVIEKDCTKLIPLEKFKKLQVVPAKVVKVLFEKLL